MLISRERRREEVRIVFLRNTFFLSPEIYSQNIVVTWECMCTHKTCICAYGWDRGYPPQKWYPHSDPVNAGSTFFSHFLCENVFSLKFTRFQWTLILYLKKISIKIKFDSEFADVSDIIEPFCTQQRCRDCDIKANTSTSNSIMIEEFSWEGK